MSRGFFMPKSFRKLLSGTDGMLMLLLLVCRGGWAVGVLLFLSANKLTERTDTMNTMIGNNEPQATIEMLRAMVERLEQELAGKSTVLKMADESLQSYKRQISDTKANVEALAHENLDLVGTEFFDGVVDLFDIELTKTVTYQYSVSVEVQATVPAGYDEDELVYELTRARLDYTFFGDKAVIIDDFSFGEMEQE